MFFGFEISKEPPADSAFSQTQRRAGHEITLCQQCPVPRIHTPTALRTASVSGLCAVWQPKSPRTCRRIRAAHARGEEGKVHDGLKAAQCQCSDPRFRGPLRPAIHQAVTQSGETSAIARVSRTIMMITCRSLSDSGHSGKRRRIQRQSPFLPRCCALHECRLCKLNYVSAKASTTLFH